MGFEEKVSVVHFAALDYHPQTSPPESYTGSIIGGRTFRKPP